MEPEVDRPTYVQMWLPGFAPAVTQPELPGFGGEDEIEPSVADLEQAKWEKRK